MKKLREKGIDALLVGGACVSIYTENKYYSSDLDFVSHASLKDISTALSEIGFKRKGTRHFERSDCPLFLEFVSPPAAIGSEPIREKGEVKTISGTVVMLTATDCVKDRLAAYYHWNDPQALEQALMVARDQKVNLKEIERWSVQEGFREKYHNFFSQTGKKYRSQSADG